MSNLTKITETTPPVHLKELADAPFSVTYVLPSTDYGAGFTEVIETPPGFRGVVRNVSLYNVTEQFTAVTTPAYCYVGISGDTDAFVTSASLGVLDVDEADNPVLSDGATKYIQPNTTVHVTGVAPTGGTAAGICTTAVTIQFFK